jgi:hypothetical protein
VAQTQEAELIIRIPYDLLGKRKSPRPDAARTGSGVFGQPVARVVGAGSQNPGRGVCSISTVPRPPSTKISAPLM